MDGKTKLSRNWYMIHWVGKGERQAKSAGGDCVGSERMG